ncbi:MAG: PIN domain-containing protein [Pseudomonadota bacterium]|nr:PIN domain-containing protein [Pseudomonadota bacterium]
MSALLVDTGPLVALAVRRDNFHAACTGFLQNHRGRLLTTWAVLTEFSHLVGAVEASLPLYRWIANGGLEIFSLGRDEIVRASDWIERYADRPMDLADASLVVASLATGYTQVWTLDRNDFETYRLPGRKRFKLVEMG